MPDDTPLPTWSELQRAHAIRELSARLEACGGNVSHTAETLELDRSYLAALLAELGVRPRARRRARRTAA